MCPLGYYYKPRVTFPYRCWYLIFLHSYVPIDVLHSYVPIVIWHYYVPLILLTFDVPTFTYWCLMLLSSPIDNWHYYIPIILLIFDISAFPYWCWYLTLLHSYVPIDIWYQTGFLLVEAREKLVDKPVFWCVLQNYIDDVEICGWAARAWVWNNHASKNRSVNQFCSSFY